MNRLIPLALLASLAGCAGQPVTPASISSQANTGVANAATTLAKLETDFDANVVQPCKSTPQQAICGAGDMAAVSKAAAAADKAIDQAYLGTGSLTTALGLIATFETALAPFGIKG
jgi:hypothetical protein